jgi:uncharacterized 2Fe-2S/4Fe-4S cluster protein (DUF4445 family)
VSDEATVSVTFEPGGHVAVVPHGTTLLAAARAAGVVLDAPCDGMGTCGSCRVLAEGALSALSASERELLGGAALLAGKRLACRARALGDVRVTLPQELPAGALAGIPTFAVSVSGERVQGVPPARQGIGVAVDVGTTTLALALVDLATGETLASASDFNGQRIQGADVMSRIAHAASGGAPELRAIVLRQIETLTLRMLEEAGRSPVDLARLVLVGNPTMLSLAFGHDVTPLGEAPYEGAHLDATALIAAEAGLDAFGPALLYAPPAIGPFVGADITAGLVTTGLDRPERPAALIDLGTNGEIVLATPAGLLATSTAAGPAFEGAAIGCGMRATAGAIERVDVDAHGSLALGVIGEGPARGLCGSGLIDLVAQLLETGVLEPDGRFAEDAPHPLGSRLGERDGVRTFTLDERGEVVFTQKDVRQVQLAVAAVRTGIELLLAEAGLAPEGVAEALVAGAFGYRVRASSLARVGVVPAEWAGRVRFVGNSALAGARAMLLGDEVRERAEQVAARARAIDLAAHPAFEKRFITALAFPGAAQ